MIIANQLSKTFGRFQAVKDASFTIEKGDIVGFLGPNGAGKTTTLRMLTGYLPPTTGTATIAGCDIVKQTQAARKHLGYL
ncbi:MAG: ATP-binding cassette domain-containing protein, partial [Akkermansia sp.]